jgi:glycosyltransferase involved in cell wall biosynthesis
MADKGAMVRLVLNSLNTGRFVTYAQQSVWEYFKLRPYGSLTIVGLLCWHNADSFCLSNDNHDNLLNNFEQLKKIIEHPQKIRNHKFYPERSRRAEIRNQYFPAPLVSVIIPSYNHAPFLRTCIGSVCTHDYPAFEVIVIDDGSTDNSRKILEDLRYEFDFQLIFQENQGLGCTINRGITEFSSGKYITICASDDTWLPGKLRKQVQFLEDNPGIHMVYGKSEIIDFDGNILEKQTSELNRELKGGNIFREIIMLDFHPPVNYMYRADIFKESGLFETKGCAEDFDMNLRISAKYPIGYIDEFLATYRRGANSNYGDNPLHIVRSHRHSIDKFRDSRWYAKAVTRWHYRNFIWFAYRKGYKLFALKSMVCSIGYCFRMRYIKGIRNLVFRWI